MTPVTLGKWVPFSSGGALSPTEWKPCCDHHHLHSSARAPQTDSITQHNKQLGDLLRIEWDVGPEQTGGNLLHFSAYITSHFQAVTVAARCPSITPAPASPAPSHRGDPMIQARTISFVVDDDAFLFSAGCRPSVPSSSVASIDRTFTCGGGRRAIKLSLVRVHYDALPSSPRAHQ